MTQAQGESGALVSQPDIAETSPARPRRTLGLTGITINAMALLAPGALMWLVYPSQAAGWVAGAADIWPGVVLALGIALLTSAALGELARRYPKSGLRSAYHLAESVFRDRRSAGQAGGLGLPKFLIGWSAHLYYWVYPGILVAFTGLLADTLFNQFGYHPTVFGKLILTASFSALVGFLALRGITGSTTSSVVLNVLQLSALLVFSVTALLFRGLNPLGLPASDWVHPSVEAVLMPHSLQGLVFQAALAMVLLVGFEASVALGAKAGNAARDVPRAGVLALVIQGALAYLLEYFAAGLALNQRLDLSSGRMVIADLSLQTGNALLAGNGKTVLLATAFTIFIALLAATINALNNGVRISFSMSLDDEIPSVLGFLHPRFATPTTTVILQSAVAALIGSIGVLGGAGVLMGLILAAVLGAFCLYAVLSGLTIAAYHGRPEARALPHRLGPGLSLLANLAIALVFPLAGLASGGVPAQGSIIALAAGGAWMAICAAYFLARWHGGRGSTNKTNGYE